jgi:succinoglycan biosynthesis transport protein ExoP
MLQTLRSPPTIPDHGAQQASDYLSPAELLKTLTGFLHRQYPVILFTFLVMMVLAVVYLFTTPSSFTAQAKLLIDTRKNQLFQQQSVLGDIPPDPWSVDSQVEILQSENVALAVIKELHLTADPEFMSPREGLFPAMKGWLFSLFASSGGPPSEEGLTRGAIGRLQSQLSTKRVGLTYIINIDFRAHSPQRAAQIANAIAEAYIVDQLEAKYQATRRAGNWMQDRIKELREQVSTAAQAVVDFKTKNNIVDTGGRGLMNEQQLAELNSSLVQARAQTAEAKAKLNRINEIMHAGLEVPDATVADSLKSEVITKLRSQYLEYSRKEAEFSSKYGSNHLAAVNLRNQMRELRKVTMDELGRIAQTYQSDYEIAKAREESITKSLADIVSVSQTTNQAQIALRDLESSAQTYRALHDSFLQRYMESVQQQSFPITEARLITTASPPGRPSNPKTSLVLVAGAFAGMIFGFALGLFREIADRVFRTGDQVASILHTDCLAVLPKVVGTATSRSNDTRNYGDLDHRIIKRDRSLFWAVVDSPFSRFAEAIRAIKVAADLSKSVKANKVVGMTSSLPNEGKTTISMALAQSIANGGARVVLLDADLRNPSLSRRLVPEAKVGLLEVLAKQVAIEDALCVDPDTRLAFLPCVVNERMAHSSQVLASEETKQLFERLRQSYDYIIVDLSPLAPVVDVRAMTHLVDSFVFIIEWGRTKIEVVEHALGTAQGVYDNLLGVVLNKADLNVLSRYETHRGNYYHNRYYARYGYTD